QRTPSNSYRLFRSLGGIPRVADSGGAHKSDDERETRRVALWGNGALANESAHEVARCSANRSSINRSGRCTPFESFRAERLSHHSVRTTLYNASFRTARSITSQF